MMNLYTPIKDAMLQAFCLEHKVRPMARPRIANGRIYCPDTTSELASMLHAKRFGPPLTDPILVDCHFHFKQPAKGGVWPVSNMIGDEDNLRKTVNDALVKAQIVDDDRLVVGGETSKIYSSDDYVWIFIYAISDQISVRKFAHD